MHYIYVMQSGVPYEKPARIVTNMHDGCGISINCMHIRFKAGLCLTIEHNRYVYAEGLLYGHGGRALAHCKRIFLWPFCHQITIEQRTYYPFIIYASIHHPYGLSQVKGNDIN